MRRNDILVGSVALAACAAAFALTFYFTKGAAAAMLEGLGAEFFPRLVLAVAAILAVCILFGIANPPMDEPAPVPGIVWVTVAVLAAYIFVMELLGMWVASFAVMVGLGWLWGERNYVKLSLASAGLLILVWLVFVRFLKGNFPGGLVAPPWS